MIPTREKQSTLREYNTPARLVCFGRLDPDNDYTTILRNIRTPINIESLLTILESSAKQV
jgi:hypothetical protein